MRKVIISWCTCTPLTEQHWQPTYRLHSSVACVMQIKEVVIAELPDAKVQQAAGLAALLQTVAPQAMLTRLELQRL
jgi:hypothetical protein